MQVPAQIAVEIAQMIFMIQPDANTYTQKLEALLIELH